MYRYGAAMLKVDNRLDPTERIGPLLEGREALIGAFRRRKDTYNPSSTVRAASR